jgi:agmatine/peptidylarginine deiminase
MKRIVFLISLVVLSLQMSAQDTHRMHPSERSLIPSYMGQVASRSASGVLNTVPPASPVRTIAEWEELQALMVGWRSYPSILRQIVAAAKQQTRVIVVYASPDSPASLTAYLAAGGVDTVNVTFLNAPINSVWSRDYGPWSAYTNDVDTLITIDWIYNRPRPADDAIPSVISSHINTPIYQTTVAPNKLVHTGGNFMTDGFGTGFSSELVVDENGPGGGFGLSLTSADIDSIMLKFMGINRYIKMTTLPYDDIHHIDMHMKLLDEETILMGQYPSGISDGPQIEANLLYVLNNFNSVFGTPYKVVRIPMPDDNNLWPSNGGDYFTYTNSSIINKGIIVPVYGVPEDSIALQIYRDQMPGYTVTPINCTSMIGALGALHCITKEVGTADPLLISHQPLENTTDTVNDYFVPALIKHRSGINASVVYWTTDTALGWTAASMVPMAMPDRYFASIPAQSPGTTIYYYISATANSGKSQVRPMPAPSGWWKFTVTGTTGLMQNNEVVFSSPFPNPSKAITCVPFYLSQAGFIKAELLDMHGRVVQVLHEGRMSSGEQRIFVDASTLADGIYMVRFNGTNNNVRLMVAH